MRDIKQVVQFVSPRYSLLPPKYRWWNRIRWALVKALGGDNPNEIVKVERLHIDAEEFVARLFKQRRELFRHFNREAKRVYIGAEDYEEMMDSPIIRDQLRFTASYNYGRNEVCGMEVTIVPWMRGVLVMP